mmetsp:Transcript_46018/g.90679  ORF Transcript_46018/g.90679 Transcript_46018/m.90679 type:complete len:96 (+) Transcript_46018:2904-3191(+)
MQNKSINHLDNLPKQLTSGLARPSPYLPRLTNEKQSEEAVHTVQNTVWLFVCLFSLTPPQLWRRAERKVTGWEGRGCIRKLKHEISFCLYGFDIV